MLLYLRKIEILGAVIDPVVNVIKHFYFVADRKGKLSDTRRNGQLTKSLLAKTPTSNF